MTRHFLDIADVAAADLRHVIDEAKTARHTGRGHTSPEAQGKTLAMIFEKPSTRTRVSFEMAIRNLGGHAIVLSGRDMQLGRGESIADTARVLSRYVDAIMIRTDHHDKLMELAHHATVPVINGLTDKSHPCQIMADIMTIEQHRGDIRNKRLAWCGDGNNVCRSLIEAAVPFGYELAIATPDGYRPPEDVLEWAKCRQARVSVTDNPVKAVTRADAVFTDTFVSMGDSDEKERLKALLPYQVNDALMSCANREALFLHCLPAHRDEEVTDTVIDGPNSVVFDEAENRMWAQQAILSWCLKA